MARRASVFRRLADNLAELAGLPSRITKPIADRLTDRLKVQFAEGSDPYGTAWKTLSPYTIRKKGHDLIMIETGRMRAETVAVAMSGAGIMLLTVPYAAYHMQASGNRPARPVLPHRKDLPIVWQTIIAEEWERAFTRTMSKR